MRGLRSGGAVSELSVMPQWELWAGNSEGSKRLGNGIWGDESKCRAEIQRGVDANEGKGLRSFANENGEPPFGIEKANVEGSLGGSFRSSWRRDSLKVSGC